MALVKVALRKRRLQTGVRTTEFGGEAGGVSFCTVLRVGSYARTSELWIIPRYSLIELLASAIFSFGSPA